MTMAFEIKNAAYESDLKSRAVNVLSYLCDRSDNKTLTCFPSLKTIAKCLHIGLTTVKRAMAELVEKGFVKKDPRFSQKKNGAQTSNLYTLSIPSHKTNKESPQATDEVMEKVSMENPQDLEEDIQKSKPYQAKYITFEDILVEFQEQKEKHTIEENNLYQEVCNDEIPERKPNTTIPKPEPTVPVTIIPPVHSDHGITIEKQDESTSNMNKFSAFVSKVGQGVSDLLQKRKISVENLVAEATLPRSVTDNFEKYLYDSTIRSMSDLAYELEWERDYE